MVSHEQHSMFLSLRLYCMSILYVQMTSQVHHKLWSLRARSVLAHFAADVSTYPQLSQTLVDMQKACFAEIGVDVEHGCVRVREREREWMCAWMDERIFRKNKNNLECSMCKQASLTRAKILNQFEQRCMCLPSACAFFLVCSCADISLNPDRYLRKY